MKLFFPICVVAMATLGVAVPKIKFFTTPCYIGPVCQKLQVLEYFHKICCYHGNDDSAHTKNDWRLRFTITHLHAKFEDDPRLGKNCRS